MTDFPRLLHALHAAEVEYIIVGGLAATIHGSARLTQDLDVVYSRTAENLQRVVDCLRPFDPYLRGAPPPTSRDGALAYGWEADRGEDPRPRARQAPQRAGSQVTAADRETA